MRRRMWDGEMTDANKNSGVGDRWGKDRSMQRKRQTLELYKLVRKELLFSVNSTGLAFLYLYPKMPIRTSYFGIAESAWSHNALDSL